MNTAPGGGGGGSWALIYDGGYECVALKFKVFNLDQF